MEVFRKGRLLGGLLIGIIACGIHSCSFPQTEKKDGGPIGVVVTIPPLKEFVERIGGNRVKVTVMVPPGASPHTYDPLPSQIKEASRAKMYAKVGTGIEFELAWMDKLIDANRDMLVVNCALGIELIITNDRESVSPRSDPHVWLSPKNAKVILRNILRGLATVDPDGRQHYFANSRTYIMELNELDRKIRMALSGKEQRSIMVYHPAWQYFCREYGLIQIPVEEEGKEPTPKGIARLIDQAKEYKVKVIFAAPEFNSQSAEVIAKEIGGEVVRISPLREHYLKNLESVAQAFSRALP